MHHLRLAACICLCLIVPLLAAGCQYRDDPEQRVVHTPLELDPMDQPSLLGWWSNDEQLLHVGDRRRYALYGSLNRFRAPLERGRWTQPSYAYIWLETYGATRQGLMRVNVRMIDGRLALVMPGREPFHQLDQPPQTREEHFFGEWRSAGATVSLHDSLRYAWSVVHGHTERLPADHRISHSGRWAVDEMQIVLWPNSPELRPMQLRIEQDEQSYVWLNLDGLRFRRAADASPSASE